MFYNLVKPNAIFNKIIGTETAPNFFPDNTTGPDVFETTTTTLMMTSDDFMTRRTHPQIFPNNPIWVLFLKIKPRVNSIEIMLDRLFGTTTGLIVDFSCFPIRR